MEALLEREGTAVCPQSWSALLPCCRRAVIFSCARHSKSLLLIYCLVLISCFFSPKDI